MNTRGKQKKMSVKTELEQKNINDNKENLRYQHKKIVFTVLSNASYIASSFFGGSIKALRPLLVITLKIGGGVKKINKIKSPCGAFMFLRNMTSLLYHKQICNELCIIIIMYIFYASDTRVRPSHILQVNATKNSKTRSDPILMTSLSRFLVRSCWIRSI